MVHCGRIDIPSRSRTSARMSSEPENATAGVDLKSLKEELTCSICLEICIRPCSTPCGHSFCRRCLRDAMRYSPRCPKCREALAPGSLNVNSVLWNTIQMLFPKTSEAPPSPPTPSPIRRATDRRQLRQLLNYAEADMLTNSEIERTLRGYFQSHSQSRLHSGESYGSRRRRRMSPTTQDNHGTRNVTRAAWRDPRVSASLSRAHRAAGATSSISHITQDGHQHLRSLHHGTVGSPLLDSHALNSPPSDPSTPSIRQETNISRTHREDNALQEMLSSSEHPWNQTLSGQRRAASGIRNGHGIGVVNSLSRSASHGDLQNDVEYVSVQRVQRVEQAPMRQRLGVYRLENLHRLQRRNTDQYVTPIERVPDRHAEFTSEPEFEDDYETASEFVSDRDSSFTSSIAAPFPGSHHNSFRLQDDVASSPVSIAATQNEQSESAVASFAGYERLYDISSQIEAAMDQIERLSMQPGWSRPRESSQPPATPLTHRSCFQLSDEDEDEEVDWNPHIRDAVFLVDDLESDSESDVASMTSPFEETEDALHPMAVAPRMSSVEESYYY